MKAGETRVFVQTGDAQVAAHFSTALGNDYDVVVDTALTVDDPDTQHLVILDPQSVGGELGEYVSGLLDQHANRRVMLIEDGAARTFDQYTMFRLGVHGFCHTDIAANLLAKAVQVILEGEYWIPRKLITQVISEIASDADGVVSSPDGPEDSLISTLTPRELQVARMVHMGGNNKMIARELDISERTVKAHLSAIFRKLDIENRLHLALYFSSRT